MGTGITTTEGENSWTRIYQNASSMHTESQHKNISVHINHCHLVCTAALFDESVSYFL